MYVTKEQDMDKWKESKDEGEELRDRRYMGKLIRLNDGKGVQIKKKGISNNG